MCSLESLWSSRRTCAGSEPLMPNLPVCRRFRSILSPMKRWRGPAPVRDTDSQAPSHCPVRAVECHPAMVLFNGNHDALMDGICSGSVDLVRSLVGRVRNHHPASHRGPDATCVRKVLSVELVALGRGGPQDSTAGAAFELPRRLWPPLGRAPPRALGGADDRRFHADLSWAGFALPGGGRIGWLWHAPLHERVNLPDARVGRCDLSERHRPVVHPSRG